ncbi:signal peptidase I [Clostridium swellfunianum]|uniref:signal peptidase I n=1 Tax=Clostridium swellfunianum TaxID=1367462 RepID=UPI00202F45DA|nr:signal peptidase I [Clostridium swellfunianum]
MKLTIKLINNLLFGLLILLFLGSLYSLINNRENKSYVPSIFGYKMMTVLSGSMDPGIKAGDVIFAKSIDADSVKIGDVITYKTENNDLITHRVTNVKIENKNVYFVTKGDSNNVEDSKPVPYSNVVGILAFRIPYGGWVLEFVNSKVGIVLFIFIPIFILIFGEVKTILSELKKQSAAE